MHEDLTEQTLHLRMMARTLELARNGFIKIAPSPFRGALLAHNDTIVGEGYLANRDAVDGEVHALKAAGDKAKGATLYVNLEPAYGTSKGINLVERILDAGIARIVVALRDPNPVVSGKTLDDLRQAGVEVIEGVLADEAFQLNEIYLTEVVTRRPFVHLLTAMSLDGKIATRLQDSNGITGPETREFVQQLRSRYDAIMIGVNTVLQDNPTLNCKALRGCDPWRIIIDTEAKSPQNSKIFLRSDPNEPRPPVLIVIGYGAHEDRLRTLRLAGAEIIHCPDETHEDPRVDLARLMPILYKRGITSVLIEGGATLRGTALEAGIVDKVSFLVAPKLIGGSEATTAVGGEGVAFVHDAWPVNRMHMRSLGSDLLIEGYLK
jgi:diaminohydroxyphosphoribosylaminopyrimidine deaminase / 5-amino-6-(5-phosphoribosylamino)uracil reductase